LARATRISRSTFPGWRRIWYSLCALGCALPPIFLAWFVMSFGIDTPHQDDWVLAGLLARSRAGELTFEDLYAQNNEHRFLFPRLLWIPLGLLTNWNVKAFMWLNFMMAVIGWLAIARIASRQAASRCRPLFCISLFVSGAVYFSVAQFENWLMAYQGFSYVQLCIALAVFFATNPESSSWRRFSLAAACCVVASFSSAHGLLSWLALLPAIGRTANPIKRRGRLMALWIALFVLCASLYSIGFRRPREDWVVPWLYPVHHPDVALLFFLAQLGNPLTLGLPAQLDRPRISAVVGSVLLGGFLALVWRALRTRRAALAAPWLALGASAILFTGAVTVGRSGWGFVSWALLSRYTTPTLYLPVSVIHLAYALLVSERRPSPDTSDATDPGGHRPTIRAGMLRWAYTVVLVGSGLLIAANSIAVVETATRWSRERETAGKFIAFARYIDPAVDGARGSGLYAVFPVVGFKVLPWVEIAASAGFKTLVSQAMFVEDVSREVGRVERREFRDTDRSIPGAWRDGLEPTTAVLVSGWAVAPEGRAAADLVLVGCQQAQRFVTAAIPRKDRPDLALARWLADSRVGWEVSVPTALLPASGCELAAWVYSPSTREFVRLPGQDR
jgi:hypothetical protein